MLPPPSSLSLPSSSSLPLHPPSTLTPLPGCPWDMYSFLYATVKGHLEITKYLWENGCDICEDAYMLVALHKHVNIFEYFREIGLVTSQRKVRKFFLPEFF
jgi:hypothetical protein